MFVCAFVRACACMHVSMHMCMRALYAPLHTCLQVNDNVLEAWPCLSACGELGTLHAHNNVDLPPPAFLSGLTALTTLTLVCWCRVRE